MWRSEIPKLDYITVLLVTDDSDQDYQDYQDYEVRPEGNDYASYVEQWGERPFQ